MLRCFARTTASALVFEALLDGSHQASLNSFGHRLAFHPFKDAERFFRGIAHHETVGTLADMPVKFSQFLRIEGLLDIAVKLLQKLLTGKQRRLLPFS